MPQLDWPSDVIKLYLEKTIYSSLHKTTTVFIQAFVTSADSTTATAYFTGNEKDQFDSDHVYVGHTHFGHYNIGTKVWQYHSLYRQHKMLILTTTKSAPDYFGSDNCGHFRLIKAMKKFQVPIDVFYLCRDWWFILLLKLFKFSILHIYM